MKAARIWGAVAGMLVIAAYILSVGLDYRAFLSSAEAYEVVPNRGVVVFAITRRRQIIYAPVLWLCHRSKVAARAFNSYLALWEPPDTPPGLSGP